MLKAGYILSLDQAEGSLRYMRTTLTKEYVDVLHEAMSLDPPREHIAFQYVGALCRRYKSCLKNVEESLEKANYFAQYVDSE